MPLKITIDLSTSKITQQIIQYLKNYTGSFVWRQNNKPVKNRQNNTIKGIPDICGFTRKGRALFIEVKNKNTRDSLSKEQIAFKEECKKRGAIYIVASSLNEVINVMEAREVGIG